MTCTHVTNGERKLIYQWKQAGFSRRKIAGLLSRAPSTIGRELNRNTGKRGYRPRQGRAHVCKETVYKYIYEDAKKEGCLWKHLPRAKRRRKRRCPRQDGRRRGVIPGRRGIETRPVVVELRVKVGHWEGDLGCREEWLRE